MKYFLFICVVFLALSCGKRIENKFDLISSVDSVYSHLYLNEYKIINIKILNKEEKEVSIRYTLVNPCYIATLSDNVNAALIVDSVQSLFVETIATNFNPPDIIEDSMMKKYNFYFKREFGINSIDVLSDKSQKEVVIKAGKFVVLPVILKLNMKTVNGNVWQRNHSYVKGLTFPLQIKKDNQYCKLNVELSLNSNDIDTLLR